MNTFKFFKEIDFEQFKRLYNRLTGREIHSGEEWSSFKDELVSWLILNQGLDIEALKTNFGFKDERGIYRFLKLPEIHELLLNRISIPTQIFTPRLLQKLSLCKSQVEKIETPILELKSVLSLYPVFEFIKHLTDEEMTILEPYIQKEVRDYFKGSTLKKVHSRLNELNFDEFEQTYQACFAGFGENILASIINRLQLHIFLTKGLVFKDHDSFLMCEFNDRHQSGRTSKRRCTIS